MLENVKKIQPIRNKKVKELETEIFLVIANQTSITLETNSLQLGEPAP